MTPQEIYSLRFCLGHTPPSGDLRQALAKQLEGAPPKVNPELSTWEEIRAFAKARYKEPQYSIEAAKLRHNSKDYWQYKLRLAKSTDRPFVVRLMYDVVNRWPTFESLPQWCFSFWQDVQHKYLLSPYGDLVVGAILEHNLYRRYLNTDENIGPNSYWGKRKGSPPPDENLARELHEIGTTGPGVLEQNGADMTQAALLLTGLRSDGFDPGHQEPGDRHILGKTFKATPDSPQIIENYLRWIAMHPATARHQTAKLATPLLGRGLTPDLHEHMQQVWLDTGGDQRKVLQAMVLHDAAWSPIRAAPLSTTVRRVMHIVANNVDVPLDRDTMFPKRNTGYDFERAPTPEGLPIDERLISSSFLLYPLAWEGTNAQRLAAMSYKRTIV